MAAQALPAAQAAVCARTPSKKKQRVPAVLRDEEDSFGGARPAPARRKDGEKAAYGVYKYREAVATPCVVVEVALCARSAEETALVALERTTSVAALVSTRKFPLVASDAQQTALQLRLARFLGTASSSLSSSSKTDDEPRTACPALVGDESRATDALYESREMTMRLARTLGTLTYEEGAHFDKVGSTLAAPLTAAAVFCHAEAALADCGATLLQHPLDCDDESSPSEGARLLTSDLGALQRSRRGEWAKAQAEQHALKGEDAQAYRLFGQAASLFEEDQRRVFHEPAPGFLATRNSEQRDEPVFFVYSREAHLSAIRVQRNFRRHLRLLSEAVTRFDALYRGHYVRDKARRATRRSTPAHTLRTGLRDSCTSGVGQSVKGTGACTRLSLSLSLSLGYRI